MIKIQGKKLPINYFPDGTPRLNFNCIYLDIDIDEEINIEWLYEPNEEMILYYIMKHIGEKYSNFWKNLYMAYIPNARMDRVKSELEVFTLKYFCEFINNLKFNAVYVRDAHSNVSIALLNNVHEYEIDSNSDEIISLESSICIVGEQINPDIIFYPDEGAYKRYSDLIQFPCMFGIKKRDWNTGKITGLDIYQNGNIFPSNAKILIIDDISSYGGTFYHAGKKLKEMGAGDVYLYVTHCENSIISTELDDNGNPKGLLAKADCPIKKVFTTESIFTKSHPLVEVIK